MIGTVKAPCQNCLERCVGCHSECDKYKSYKLKLTDENSKIQQGKDVDNMMRGIAIKRILRQSKR